MELDEFDKRVQFIDFSLQFSVILFEWEIKLISG